MGPFFIIGGTGTLGEAFINRALKDGHKITSFSRCELKAKELAARVKNENLKFVIGDIRDPNSVRRAMQGHKSVFHFAALKHVDVLERFPEEAVKTNVLGTINVLDACEQNDVEHFVFSSTDKAVSPINSYGFSKAMAEKIIFARNRRVKNKVFRWGNIVGSRGSVIPIFVKTLLKNGSADITHPKMTRFWLKIDYAVEFVYSTFLNNDCSVQIPDAKCAKVIDVIQAVASILSVKNPKINVTGIRPGEKLHERLLEDGHDSSSKEHTFTNEELRDYLEPLVLEFAK